MISAPVIEKLEYPEIRDRVAAYCRYSVGKELAREMTPGADVAMVRYQLDLTSEASDAMVSFPELSVGGARDIREFIQKASKGGRLMPAELLLVMDTLRAGRELRHFFLRIPETEDRFPNLRDIVDGVSNFSPLESELNRAIGPRGDVLDSASEELSRIRRAIRVAYNRLTDRLNNLVSGGRFGSALQENLITIREGRYVIPVRAESRGLVKGIVHDTSASGQTLFVEPYDVVEMNNRWREEQMNEEREVERILDDLSSTISEQSELLLVMVDSIARIDLALGKARFASSIDATRPALYEAPRGTGRDADAPGHPTHFARLDNARHPLLDAETVVPISVELGERFRMLLITGPNTGGKTVALKTFGLLTLMAQSGLFIPADDTSVISVFPKVYVDIGDEQSIEQSLSTFSSHLRNIVEMLRQVGSDSLVLLDEVGAGTDPQEGSALARALMSALLERRAMVLATTHYSEVKAYAFATRGVENASVEFDVQSLRPTYRMMVGVPGRSNALSIASRLGMPGPIIEEARSLLVSDDDRAEGLIEDIRTRRDEITAELERVQQAHEEARTLRRKAAQSIRDAEDLKRTAREDALAEIEDELVQARAAIRDLERRTSRFEPAKPDVHKEAEAVRTASEMVRAAQRQRSRPKAAPPTSGAEGRRIRSGDRVRILSIGEEGDVVSVEDGEAEVQMGSLKVRQSLSELERIGRSRTREDRAERPPQPAPETVPIELDIRGQRAEEVINLLERYLNDAYLMGMPWLRIIHGKGTGALRKVVREQLKQSPVVSRSEAAGPTDGGDGATIAHMKQA